MYWKLSHKHGFRHRHYAKVLQSLQSHFHQPIYLYYEKIQRYYLPDHLFQRRASKGLSQLDMDLKTSFLHSVPTPVLSLRTNYNATWPEI